MRHAKARRLLPSVLDHALPARVEGQVRAHADRCRRCRAALAELRATDQLLSRLPGSLLPLDQPGGREDRLLALARWVTDPPLTWRERTMTALSAAGATAAFVMLLELGSLLHGVAPPAEPVQLAVVLPEARLFPTGLR